jgi:hypothetical protein
VSTDISEKHIASIFKVDEEAIVKAGGKQSFHAGFLLSLFFEPER